MKKRLRCNRAKYYTNVTNEKKACDFIAEMLYFYLLLGKYAD